MASFITKENLLIQINYLQLDQSRSLYKGMQLFVSLNTQKSMFHLTWKVFSQKYFYLKQNDL